MELGELRKFPVGSQVMVVRKDLSAGLPRHPMWQPEMDWCLGKAGTIVRFCDVSDAVHLDFPGGLPWSFHHTSLEPMPTKTDRRVRKDRTQEPYYHPKGWTLAELEQKIGHRGSVQRKRFKRNLVIMWLRIKTQLPFKPDLWALPSRVARNFYNDKTDEMWKEWARAHPARQAGSEGGAKVKVERRYAEAVEKAEEVSPFETTLVVKRHRMA